MHMALRAPRDQVFSVDDDNVVPAVHEVLDKVSQGEESILKVHGIISLIFFSFFFPLSFSIHDKYGDRLHLFPKRYALMLGLAPQANH